MIKRNQPNIENALNKLALVAHTLRYISSQEDGSELGALLQILGIDLEECLLALDPPSRQ